MLSLLAERVGRRGLARAAAMLHEERSEKARKAVLARWAKAKESKSAS
jgi:hypothetical protein